MGLSNYSEGDFWVYENDPTNRARVHKGDCGYCNHGEGIHGQGDSENARWHGPFATIEAACDEMDDLGKRDSGACYFCDPCYG